MPHRKTIRRSAALPLFALASCVAPPTPVAAPPAVPPLIALPAAPSPGVDWRDWPLTPGRWNYRPGAAPAAAFSAGDDAVVFELRCDPAAQTIALLRAAPSIATPRTMTITTSDGDRALATGGGGIARLPARDPLLDRMAFSRGRIVVALAGAPRLVLPAWAEIGRVVEDCR